MPMLMTHKTKMVKVTRREGEEGWVGKCSRRVYIIHIGVRLEVEKEGEHEKFVSYTFFF